MKQLIARVMVFVTVVVLVGTSVRLLAADILTTADIQKVSGLTGITTTAKNAITGAAGDLNFAGADGKLVAIVMISTSMFDTWQKKYGGFGEPVPELGADAFRTKPKAMINYVVFRKGGTAVWIQSMGYKKDGSQTLDAKQLTDLAKIAASRMP